ncbi:MAG: pyridoxal-phosphate dependent enzyme [Alphaproteobacteria bacterium]|nr:pyridoxal-phosphate dependent enzyme [Alphaproteobacteria bacterium]
MVRSDAVPAGPADRSWHLRAIGEIDADFHRSSDTHLLRLPLPEFDGVDIYLKDESTHPSGSLKHRLARSLFLYGLCNGRICEDAPVIEASSGSTAVSEAYFARLIGSPFIAVVPEGTACAKIDQIRFYGGEVRMTKDASTAHEDCLALARETGGVFLDQFVNAERATDWRGNNNIAESLFGQLAHERFPAPEWVVVGAGTGGTSATIGRYIRYQPHLAARTRLCVVDPEGSALFDFYRTGEVPSGRSASRVAEGIGRPVPPASFIPSVIDLMIEAPNAAALAAMLWLEQRLGRRCGPSTGANMIAALRLADHMRRGKQTGSIVTLICDSGERYAETVYSSAWREARGIDPGPVLEDLQTLDRSGRFGADLRIARRQAV